ncbi:MAG: MATE family efflux transporter [Lachnospiraceae bacterium]|nr:MATE family efflux transporter [Lachnospiraceae bacterium]
MTNSAAKENKMGVMPIPKLLISMSLPMIISMLVQALYNVVDSIFVAQMNEAALTAVSLAFPIQNLMIAVAAGTGVGINALLSRSLGEKKFETANTIAANGIFLALASSVVFAILGILGSRLFFVAQTDDTQIIQYGTQYMTIITICSVFIFLQITYERLLQSTGKTIFNMITQATGAIINIILDPILIFGYFGLPAMGVTGAALATVIGQCIAVLLAIYFNHKYNTEITVKLRKFKPCRQTISNIYKIGVPSIIMQSIGSVTTFAMNNILLMFSSTAAAVYGVYFKLQSFVFMPIFGLTNGMIPIVAYNYGARNKKRIFATIKLSIVIAVGIMGLGVAGFQLFPHALLGLFDASETMYSIGIPALRIISLSFIFAGFCIICGCVFQALGNGVYSMLISGTRQLIVIIPLAFLFAKLFGLNMIWWAFPLAEIASLTLSVFFLRRIIHKKIDPIPDEE